MKLSTTILSGKYAVLITARLAAMLTNIERPLLRTLCIQQRVTQAPYVKITSDGELFVFFKYRLG